MISTLVLATHSAGKKAEFARLLTGLPITLYLASDFDLPSPVEDGKTFEANATIKALAAAHATRHPALAEDSGLMIDALDGQPGVDTALWYEDQHGHRNQMLGNNRILDALAQSGQISRRAVFVSVIVQATPDGQTCLFRAETIGTIADQIRGERGFGFDPLFIPEGSTSTFGEMDDITRLGFSARRKVCDMWRQSLI